MSARAPSLLRDPHSEMSARYPTETSRWTTLGTLTLSRCRARRRRRNPRGGVGGGQRGRQLFRRQPLRDHDKRGAVLVRGGLGRVLEGTGGVDLRPDPVVEPAAAAEDDPGDEMMVQSATRIQAVARARRDRRAVAALREENAAAVHIQRMSRARTARARVERKRAERDSVVRDSVGVPRAGGAQSSLRAAPRQEAERCSDQSAGAAPKAVGGESSAGASRAPRARDARALGASSERRAGFAGAQGAATASRARGARRPPCRGRRAAGWLAAESRGECSRQSAAGRGVPRAAQKVVGAQPVDQVSGTGRC